MTTPNDAGNIPQIGHLLLKAGLDERESSVYFALLMLKIAPVARIARESGQERSNTYGILKNLEQKGLVSHTQRGNVLQYVAEPPQRLLRYLEDRQSELHEVQKGIEAVLPVLQQAIPPLTGKPRVILGSGLSAVRDVYRDALSQEFIGAFNPQKMYGVFGDTIMNRFLAGEVRLRGKALIVDGPMAMRYVQDHPSTTAYALRLLPAMVRFDGDCVIYGESVILFAYDDELTLIRIDSHELAGSIRSCFELLWSIGRRVAKTEE